MEEILRPLTYIRHKAEMWEGIAKRLKLPRYRVETRFLYFLREKPGLLFNGRIDSETPQFSDTPTRLGKAVGTNQAQRADRIGFLS